PAAMLVVPAAAVAEADVEQPVGAELELFAVVVLLGLVLIEDQPGAGADRPIPARPVSDDPRVAGSVGVVDVEPVRAAVVGREGRDSVKIEGPGACRRRVAAASGTAGFAGAQSCHHREQYERAPRSHARSIPNRSRRLRRYFRPTNRSGYIAGRRRRTRLRRTD